MEATSMTIPEDATLLRIFLGESDRHEGQPLYEAIVLKARELHLGGATVIRGLMGFGRSSRLHASKVLRLSEDLPIVVEIADAEDKIQALLPWLERALTGGLITLERARVVRYAGRGPETGGAAQ
jgi:PII-like signaling protein